jgi:hypothetical protein
VPGQTEQAARAVVFEAAAEYAHAGCIQSGRNGFTGTSFNRPAVKVKADGLPPLDVQDGVVGHPQTILHRLIFLTSNLILQLDKMSSIKYMRSRSQLIRGRIEQTSRLMFE